MKIVISAGHTKRVIEQPFAICATIEEFWSIVTAILKQIEGNDGKQFRYGWIENIGGTATILANAHPEPWENSSISEENSKPRMLFLDDRDKRRQSALDQFGEKWDLTIVSNAKECLRKLSEEDWDEVRLDHDLNNDDFQDPDDPTAGMAIVRYIQKCGWPANKRKPIFRVHSSNIFAAHLMVKTLQGLGLIAVWERFQYNEYSGPMRLLRETS